MLPFSGAHDDEQIVALSEAIEHFPAAPVNYVLRGEALLRAGWPVEAAQDFRAGWNLAQVGAENSDWGYIYTALMARAEEGLRRCGSIQQPES